MPNGEMWDKLFEHVDELKMTVDVAAMNAFVLALNTLHWYFMDKAIHDPSSARRAKNDFVRELRESPMSHDVVEGVNAGLNRTLRKVEKALAKKGLA